MRRLFATHFCAAHPALAWLAWVLGAIVLVLAIVRSDAQRNHGAGHNDYQGTPVAGRQVHKQ